MHIGHTEIPAPPMNGAVPPRPPLPQRDELDGFLGAYLAQPVKPHRERLVDILRVISATPTGHALLNDFSALASQDKAPIINLLPDGSSALTANATETTTVWLSRDDMAAEARQVGVAPELDCAPTVLWSLVMARNALRAEAGFKAEDLDPVDVQARFRADLAAQRTRQPLDADSAGAAARRDSAGLAARLMEKMDRRGSAVSASSDVPPGSSPTAPATTPSGSLRSASPAPLPGSLHDGLGGHLSSTETYSDTVHAGDTPQNTAGRNRAQRAVRWVVKRFTELRTRLGQGRDAQVDARSDTKSLAEVLDLSAKRPSQDSGSTASSRTPFTSMNDDTPAAPEPVQEKPPVIRAAQPRTHRRAKSMFEHRTAATDVEQASGTDQR